jgi:hypothetical protein
VRIGDAVERVPTEFKEWAAGSVVLRTKLARAPSVA